MTAATGGHTWEGMLEEIGSSSDELFPQRNVTLVFVDAAPPHRVQPLVTPPTASLPTVPCYVHTSSTACGVFLGDCIERGAVGRHADGQIPNAPTGVSHAGRPK